MKRQIKNGAKEKSAMLISISGINFYKEIYGEIACEKVLQTLAAIINSTLQKEDTTGHYSIKDFLLITQNIKAEKIAKFLTFAFDGILERFYSEFDYKNNFMLYSTETIEEKKIPLMKLDIAIADIQEGRFENEKQLLNLLFNTLKLCKNSKESCYVIDRPKLYGEVSKVNPKNKVMIMEPDESLNCLLNVNLEMQGYSIKSCLNYNDFLDEYFEFLPDILILDYGSKEKKQGLNILNTLCENLNQKGIECPKIIFSTTVQDKKNIFSNGADVYLPKPYDINTLTDWVKKLI